MSKVGFKEGFERAERGERRLFKVEKEVPKDVVERLLEVLQIHLICHNNDES